MPRYKEHGLDVDEDDWDFNGMFDALFDNLEECPECGYEGPLTLKTRGYVCAECKALILPME